LASLPSLEELSLQENHFTDRGLSYFKGNTVIRQLCVGIGGSNITDAGMPSLCGLVNLELLDLQHTKVTSKGLESLTTLNNLKSLWIGGTPAAGSPLEQVFPNCKISR
jgi:Leucine-rich repeat (LRR) protein